MANKGAINTAQEVLAFPIGRNIVYLVYWGSERILLIDYKDNITGKYYATLRKKIIK